MTWGIVAGAAISAGTAAVGAASANKAAAGSARAQSTANFNAAAESYRGTEIKYKQLQQDYEAIKGQNFMTSVRQNYRMGLMNVQQGLAERAAVQAGISTSQQAKAFMGTNSANAAAAGVIGASSDAVKNDIKMKAGEAQIQHNMNYAQQLQNFNTEVEAMALNNETQFQSPKEIITSSTATLSDPINGGVEAAYTNPWIAGAVAGAGSFASGYIKNKTSLNLGATPGANAAPSSGLFSGGVSAPAPTYYGTGAG